MHLSNPSHRNRLRRRLPIFIIFYSVDLHFHRHSELSTQLKVPEQIPAHKKAGELGIIMTIQTTNLGLHCFRMIKSDGIQLSFTHQFVLK